MKKKLKLILSIFLVLGVIVFCIVWFIPQSKPGQMIMNTVMFFAPSGKKAEDIKGIAITSGALAKEYGADEKAADTKYLNKAIEVTGTISEVDKNQDGGVMVVLQTEDPTAGVQCSMREKNSAVAKGQNITIKGFCSGNGITGVSLTDCIIKQ